MDDTKIRGYIEELEKLEIKHEIVEHPFLKTVDEVLRYCNLSHADGASTLVFKIDDGFIAVIRRDDCKVNIKELKKLANTRSLEMASDQEFTSLTNLEPGAARLYIPEVKETFIDEKIFERKYVQGGSGSFTTSIRYQTKNLLNIPNSKRASFAEIKTVTGEVKSSGVKRVLSGIRATGRLHLGNYLGAVKGMLELQSNPDYETLYMVADVHTITTPFNIEELRKNRREVIIDYLAAGLDPEKSIIFQQSEVNEHLELAFYFSSVVTINRMQHLPTFKDKVKQYPQHSTMALLNYPILMAADILVYRAGLVPVGIDQEPHLEIAREIARKMNQQYGTVFPEPKRFATKGEYIPSLKGEGKMSKSVEGSFINLTDNLEMISKKVRSIPTATTAGGEMSAGVKALFKFAELYMPTEVKGFQSQFESGTLQFVTLKDSLAQAIFQDLQPIQEKRKAIESDQDKLNKIIKDGADRASEIAAKTVKAVREKMGLA